MLKYILAMLFGSLVTAYLVLRAAVRSQSFLDWFFEQAYRKYELWLYDGELPEWKKRSGKPLGRPAYRSYAGGRTH